MQQGAIVIIFARENQYESPSILIALQQRYAVAMAQRGNALPNAVKKAR